MHLATFEPYYRSGLNHSGADQNGSCGFHTTLIEAALTSGTVEQIHIYADPRYVQVQTDAIDQLNARLGRGGLQAYSLRSFAKRLPEERSVFFCRGSHIANICHLRAALSPAAFPICGFLYAAVWPRLVADCLSILLLFQPHDAVIASSIAGARTLRAALAAAADLLAAQGLRVSPDQVNIVIENLSVHSQRLEGVSRQIARRVLGLAEDPVTLLYFGRISEAYKADLIPLITALKRVVATTSRPVQLILAGSCIEQGSIQRIGGWVATLGLGSHVRILANVAPHVKSLLYAAADVFVSPADNVQETFGLALLEAMSAGLPIIASDWSGYRELVVDGETGLLVPTYWSADEAVACNWKASYPYGPTAEGDLAGRTVVDVDAMANRLTTMIEDPTLRVRFGEAALVRFNAKYSWEVVLPRYVELWTDMRRRCVQNPLTLALGGFDFESFYRHYATCVIDDSHEVGDLDSSTPWSANPAMSGSSRKSPDGSLNSFSFGKPTISIGELRTRYGHKRVDILLKQGCVRMLNGQASTPIIPK